MKIVSKMPDGCDDRPDFGVSHSQPCAVILDNCILACVENFQHFNLRVWSDKLHIILDVQ